MEITTVWQLLPPPRKATDVTDHRPIKAHFHSRKISTDRKFSKNIIVKS
jgi:hypothetical protein